MQIAVLAFEDAQLLDLAGPAQVFASAAETVGDAAQPPYRVRLVSVAGGPVRTSAGIELVTEPLSAVAPKAVDTVIASGGAGVYRAAESDAAIAWLKACAESARRVTSVCTGAFLLASAGLLHGKRAATHWQYCAELAEKYPDIQVEPDPIFVRDGAVWTSAGVTAGIDLALALVQEDLGRATALQVARRLVVFMKRPGGQSQFSTALATQLTGGDRFGELNAWMAGNLAADLRIETLAERAGMSVRNFARRYRTETGLTPAKAVAAMRVEAAQRLLEESDLPIIRIAERCGFSEEEGLRRAFMRSLGVPPGRYRARFASASI